MPDPFNFAQPLLYQGHVLNLCKTPGNPSIRLVGHAPNPDRPDLRTEGYGGWTAKRFVTHFKPGPRQTGDWRVWNDSGSPFLYADTHGNAKLDFGRFCEELHERNAPDFVTIFLGANDLLGTNDAALEKDIAEMFGYYDQLIAVVRQKSPATKIGLMLLPPPSASQDAFGANYQCRLTREQYKRHQSLLVEKMIQRYGGREAESLFLIPTHVVLDCVHNYPRDKPAPVNAHATTQIERPNNAVHPAYPGYLQIGDVLYAWIKARLAESTP